MALLCQACSVELRLPRFTYLSFYHFSLDFLAFDLVLLFMGLLLRRIFHPHPRAIFRIFKDVFCFLWIFFKSFSSFFPSTHILESACTASTKETVNVNNSLSVCSDQ